MPWSKRVQPTRGWTVAASTQHKLYSLLLPPAMGARFYNCQCPQENEEQTEFIIFNSTKLPENIYILQISDNKIPMRDQVKILVVALDFTLTLDVHIANTCRSSYMHTRRINSIRQYLTDDAVQ